MSDQSNLKKKKKLFLIVFSHFIDFFGINLVEFGEEKDDSRHGLISTLTS